MTLTQNYRFVQIYSNTENGSDISEIWHSQEIEHASYEYNTSHSLEYLHDYWLRMIIGCKIQLTLRTWLLALTLR